MFRRSKFIHHFCFQHFSFLSFFSFFFESMYLLLSAVLFSKVTQCPRHKICIGAHRIVSDVLVFGMKT